MAWIGDEFANGIASIFECMLSAFQRRSERRKILSSHREILCWVRQLFENQPHLLRIPIASIVGVQHRKVGFFTNFCSRFINVMLLPPTVWSFWWLQSRELAAYILILCQYIIRLHVVAEIQRTEDQLFSWKINENQWFLRPFPISKPPKMERNPWFSLIFHENRWSSVHCISTTTSSLMMYWHKINIYAASSRDCSYQKDHTVGASIIKLMKREQNFAKNPTFCSGTR